MTQLPTARLALALALALAAGCSGPTKPQTEPRQESATMDDSIRALDRHPTATVAIQFGTQHFGNGEIAVAVRGDGAVSVDQRTAAGVTHYTAQLDAARVAALGRALADHKFTAARTSTLPRDPGDSPLVLRLSGSGVAAFAAELWYADRFKDPDLDAIMRIADDLLHMASGGKLGQPAPAP